MSIVPGFAYDIFISYAHVDNLPLAVDDKGWISDFHNTVRTRLLQELRKEPSIWRDQGGLDGRVVDPSIAAAIRTTAVFMAIVSPAWLESGYCRMEAANFCDYRHPAFSLAPNGFSRVVVVTLTDEALPENLPQPLREVNPVAFGETDPATGDRRLFVKPSRRDRDPYWQRIDHVVRHLVAILRELQRGASGGPEVASPAGAPRAQLPVYLAEATDDLQAERDEILGLLQRGSRKAGFEVEPPRSILQSASVQRACHDGLSRAATSIHLINATAGRIWGDAGKPLAQMELEAALQLNGKNRPLVWIPPDLRPDPKAPREWIDFLTSLRTGKLAAGDAGGRTPELFEMPFDRFFAQLESRLFPQPAGLWQETRKKQPGAFLVYVSHRSVDQVPIGALLKRLREGNYAVAWLDHGSGADIRQRHETNLRYCDGLVVVYGRDVLGWAEAIALDARTRAHAGNHPKRLGVLPGTPHSDSNDDEFGIVDELLMPIRLNSSNGFDGLDAFLAAIEEEPRVQ